jgi:hypothetical protein
MDYYLIVVDLNWNDVPTSQELWPKLKPLVSMAFVAGARRIGRISAAGRLPP